MSLEYCGWAAKRIDLVEDWPVEKWIEYDFKNTERRKSIRTSTQSLKPSICLAKQEP